MLRRLSIIFSISTTITIAIMPVALANNSISFVYESSNFGSVATITGSNLNTIAYLDMRTRCPDAWMASMSYPPYCGQQTFVGPSGLGLGDGVEDFISKSDTQIVFRLPTWVNFGSPDLGEGYSIEITGNNSSFSPTGVPSSLTFTASSSAPGAPTIGTALALSPTSASISFVAPTSDGGATIETYTATSTPGSFTGQLLQAGSGSITVTGLTSSTAYTFTVTASNSAGTSTASSASVSITMPASNEEIAEEAVQAAAAQAAATRAAAKAAAAKREADKRSAREEMITRFKNSEKPSLELFNRAEIFGITLKNIEAVQAEILSLPEKSRSDLTEVLKIARKFEVVGDIASDRPNSIYPSRLVEIGLIPADSKFKSAITMALKNLPASERTTYADIKVAIENEMARIKAKKDRLASLMARVSSRKAA